MGWNSYDSYGALATESQIKANADYMSANLKSHGYNYICLDYCWSFPYKPGPNGQTGTATVLNQTYDSGTNTYTPPLTMDQYGRLLPDAGRFPSSMQNNVEVGLKPLIDYVHSEGLKFGLHVMRGIPRQAYTSNTPVFGSAFTANQITDITSTTTWNNQMYGLNFSSSGAQAYYNSIFSMYAGWGVDFIKVDDVASPFRPSDINAINSSITATGRPMVLSVSPGPAPVANGTQFEQTTNMWRMLADLSDNWTAVNGAFSVANSWTPYRQPNSWPDADMLPLGKFIAPPNGSPRNSQLTQTEQRTLMTLWSIVKSPLIMGGDLPSLATDPFTKSLLTNDQVLAVDQTSLNNHQVSDNGTQTVWSADVANSRDKYVALFNRGSSSLLESVNFTDLGLSNANYEVFDLWTGTDLGNFSGSFSATLSSHGSGLYEINQVAFIPEPASMSAVLLSAALLRRPRRLRLSVSS